ncbi:MAG: hypothetical protein Q8T11_14175 [Elusimicrobiota bacterium]|nr:hypothetical protein [Elusimicrobiota bacterium]
MTKLIVKTSFLPLLLAAVSAHAAPAPSAPRGRVAQYEASARVMGRAGRLEPLADLTQRWQFEGLRPQRSLMLGAYGRAHRNLKLGAFYQVQSGARHDDDWTKDAAGNWFWRPAANRPENILILDATPRTSLGGRFVGSLKVRFERNFFNAQSSLKLEPEVAWFWLDGLAPKGTLFLRHGTYIPLNFGTRSFYERWWYAGGLWHPTAAISAGPSVALRDVVWTTSSSFAAASGGGSYKVLHRSLVWGLTVLVRAL